MLSGIHLELVSDSRALKVHGPFAVYREHEATGRGNHINVVIGIYEATVAAILFLYRIIKPR